MTIPDRICTNSDRKGARLIKKTNVRNILFRSCKNCTSPNKLILTPLYGPLHGTADDIVTTRSVPACTHVCRVS